MGDILISSMGFVTNSTFIPILVHKGHLVISSEFNHPSIHVGVRQSGSHVHMFKHNDMKRLEGLLHEVISQVSPRPIAHGRSSLSSSRVCTVWKAQWSIYPGLSSSSGIRCANLCTFCALLNCIYAVLSLH